MRNEKIRLELYLQNQTVDSADNARGLPIGREVAIRYLRGYWYIAGGRSTNIAVNAPNANNSTTMVVGSIHFDQAIWWLKIQHKRDRILDPLVSQRASKDIYDSSPVPTSQQIADLQKSY
ncbi:hypothetical protein GLOIN_2v1778046 [Rhizophagus clarus]|uniref:Uncharacterized protein n=1 Tax=Rhizophagus clarus TaxID=94130 RepID=A0A8H3L1U9_9GLOM|nr:hypothetical protein GLOIN_2v1778046 [Rhizophagus clarus]